MPSLTAAFKIPPSITFSQVKHFGQSVSSASGASFFTVTRFPGPVSVLPGTFPIVLREAPSAGNGGFAFAALGFTSDALRAAVAFQRTHHASTRT